MLITHNVNSIIEKPENVEPIPPSEDAEAIFKKMKETGLTPNAVVMLDGLCKAKLFQEAMKLFGLMREKGTIPKVVIYTAIVAGFCKAQKFEDVVRIFKKMQSIGIIPNAFCYGVLILGFVKGRGLVDGYCREKGLEEAQCDRGDEAEKMFY
ncbi:unnamed protein product [Fraxinus pennsylvanica]|uniref:Pentatricopeptide repeat-containing protein n=1 Tax=Fraxinus pennsylvanica TaxID=56036 RepID=A0AAD1ZTK1_9LAMI|nr:unnamed protein product [Fraxinus pennsylvanica]